MRLQSDEYKNIIKCSITIKMAWQSCKWPNIQDKPVKGGNFIITWSHDHIPALLGRWQTQRTIVLLDWAYPLQNGVQEERVPYGMLTMTHVASPVSLDTITTFCRIYETMWKDTLTDRLPWTLITRLVRVIRTASTSSNTINILVALGWVLRKVNSYKQGHIVLQEWAIGPAVYLYRNLSHNLKIFHRQPPLAAICIQRSSDQL